MEERMCQKQVSTIQHSQQQTDIVQTANCHRCKMCSSFSSSSSSSSISSSSSNISSLSGHDTHKQLPRQSSDKKSSGSCFIQQHLQSMFSLLRREETLKMAVRLESTYSGRTRYLVVVSRPGRNLTEECCLLGIDCNKSTTVGLVLKVLADTAITLDGDGGFSVSVCGRQHIFKPVSVQAMWSALQTLYKVSTKAREGNYFEGGNTHDWVTYYEKRIESDRSCINEWHTMNDIESRRPPSPDSLRSKPRERLETERVIRSTLKEIMMSVDLDEVTSKYIRSRLEEQLDMDLREFKSFIDQEMLVILGQMDEATEIFPHVYLGSEWNASNLEELNKNRICYILNVTREIDNFFPGTFDYLNIRVYDDDNTDLLKHWDNTFKYISKVKKENSKVLVHCKMGISRSASVVIAYAMKAYNWDFKKAFEFVRKKRSCIKPNQNFISQLETYQGMLDAMKNKEKLQRSKSETNLKSTFTKSRFHAYNKKKREQNSNDLDERVDKSEKVTVNRTENEYSMLRVYSGTELARLSLRPKSWSPDNLIASEIFSSTGTMSQSLEHLNTANGKLSADSHSSSVSSLSTSPPRIPPAPPLPPIDSRYNLNVRMPCENGLAYSVSQNKIVQLYSAQNQESYNIVARLESITSSQTLTSNRTYHQSEYGYSDAEKSAAAAASASSATTTNTTQITDPQPPLPPSSSHNSTLLNSLTSSSSSSLTSSSSSSTSTSSSYILQIPSQFQGTTSSVTSRSAYKSNAVNLVKKNEALRSIRVPSPLSNRRSGDGLDEKSALPPTPSSPDPSHTRTTSNTPYGVIAPTTATDTCYQSEYVGRRRDEKCLSGPPNLYSVPSSCLVGDKSSSLADDSGFVSSSDNELAKNASSPNVINTVQCASVKHRTNLLERLTNPRPGRLGGNMTTSATDDEGSKGIVLNLKKEFEAKCNVHETRKQRKKYSSQGDDNNNEDARSLPSSPVIEHSRNRNYTSGAQTTTAAVSSEDLSVRKLVGKYEVAKGAKEKKCVKGQPPIPPRKSSLEINLPQSKFAAGKNPSSGVFAPYNRGHKVIGPVVKSLFGNPNEIRSTVTKAANILQQGKTHPLSKLTFCKQRPNPPVYNTM
ncbi:protein phosphatase Slingshot [Planococcus citri]|uniref:protein phosphatase Slingshot n=1 Tax=Planococcus citri TaxID=170843 RepID=UPI0031F8AA40